MELQQSNSATGERPDAAPAQPRKAGTDGPLPVLVIALISIALLLANLNVFRDYPPSAEMANATPAPADAAPPADAVRPVEYFPDGYVNRATEPERQYETF